MAEVVYRTQSVAELKAQRLNRKNNRGLYVNTSTGFTSRDRRNVINRANLLGTNSIAAITRERLRKGWLLQDALTTVQGA